MYETSIIEDDCDWEDDFHFRQSEPASWTELDDWDDETTDHLYPLPIMINERNGGGKLVGPRLLSLRHLGPRLSIKRSLEPFIPFVDRRKINGAFLLQAVDGEWIDLDNTIRGWLSICGSQHQLHCSNTDFLQLSGENSYPKWLLDAKNWCLVPATNDKRYFALSYVWGTAKSTSTTLENLDALQKEGSLLRHDVVMPKLILDVLHLVKELGEDYLWVDRFCIVQNDEPQKTQQLQAMADIYARSHATIIAAEKSATNQGLFGLRDITRPRFLGEHMRSLDRQSIRSDKFEELRKHLLAKEATSLLDSDWGTRGWTFQEYLFSTRRIVFQNESVSWDCHCASWLECQSLPQDSILCGRSSAIIRSGESWPDVYQFARLASLYNQRLLTYPQDVHDAFSGALSVIGKVFQGGFVCGMPQIFFDAFLLWQPYTPVHRRIATGPAADRTSIHLPSWSWIGWHGDFDSKSLRSAYGYIKKQADEFFEENEEDWEPSSWSTISTVKWSYMFDLKARPVDIAGPDQIYNDIRAKHSNEFTKLPNGWTAHDNHGEKRYYTHSSDPNQMFWYPIPIRQRDSEPSPIILAPFLCGRTRRARLQLGRRFKNEITSRCVCVALENHDGKEVGFLRWNCNNGSPVIHSPRAFRRFGSEEDKLSKVNLSDNVDNEWPSQSADLIELSSGSTRYQKTEWVSFDEWSDKPKSGGLYEFYNVMMTRREGEYVSRIAVGRVDKTAWESEMLVTEYIILG